MKKYRPKGDSLQGAVAKTIETLGAATIPMIQESLGRKEPEDRKPIGEALKTLIRFGWIIHDDGETYRWAGHEDAAEKQPQKPSATQRMWGVMHDQPSFTVEDVRKLADASMNTAKRYVAQLREDGHLIEIGRKKNYEWSHCTAAAYQQAAGSPIAPPPWKTEKCKRSAFWREIQEKTNELFSLANTRDLKKLSQIQQLTEIIGRMAEKETGHEK